MNVFHTRLHLLRGVAALMVVAYHATFWAMAGPWHHWHSLSMLFFPGGTYVALFFVLSGYVTLRAHAKDFNHADRLPTYLLRRAARIYPAYWAASLVTGIWAGMGLYSWDRNFTSIYATWRMLSAFFLIEPFEAPTQLAFLVVGWTLFYEVLFYALVALAIFRLRLGLFIAAIVLVYSYWGLPGVTWRPLVFREFNILFVAGMAVARVVPYLRWPNWCLHLVVVAGFSLFYACVTFHLPLKPLFVACSLIVGGLAALDLHGPKLPPSTGLNALLGLGTISYSLYLWHMPMQTLVYATIGAPDALWKWMLYVITPLPIAWLGYHYLERPIIDWARRTTRGWNSPSA